MKMNVPSRRASLPTAEKMLQKFSSILYKKKQLTSSIDTLKMEKRWIHQKTCGVMNRWKRLTMNPSVTSVKSRSKKMINAMQIIVTLLAGELIFFFKKIVFTLMFIHIYYIFNHLFKYCIF